jgi:hypothetical protein
MLEASESVALKEDRGRRFLCVRPRSYLAGDYLVDVWWVELNAQGLNLRHDVGESSISIETGVFLSVPNAYSNRRPAGAVPALRVALIARLLFHGCGNL